MLTNLIEKELKETTGDLLERKNLHVVTNKMHASLMYGNAAVWSVNLAKVDKALLNNLGYALQNTMTLPTGDDLRATAIAKMIANDLQEIEKRADDQVSPNLIRQINKVSREAEDLFIQVGTFERDISRRAEKLFELKQELAYAQRWLVQLNAELAKQERMKNENV